MYRISRTATVLQRRLHNPANFETGLVRKDALFFFFLFFFSMGAA
jgi:hypothetical protein